MFIINTFSTCFGHHYAQLQENKTCVTARGVLGRFCWMWLVAVVGRCVVGCEHCEGCCSTLQASGFSDRNITSRNNVMVFNLSDSSGYFVCHQV